MKRLDYKLSKIVKFDIVQYTDFPLIEVIYEA